MRDTQNPISTCPSGPALGSMFAARKKVFVDRLKWDVPVLNGIYEVDQFDTPDATYLILAGQGVTHRASARILRTDRPHILRDLFPFLCDGPVPVHKTCREITRFCVDPDLPRCERRIVRDQLVTAIADHALTTGIRSYTAVATRSWADQIARFGWKCARLGDVHHAACGDLVAVRIDIDEETQRDLTREGIYRPGSYKAAIAPAEFVS
jgi:acyl homoserine lactone synthase/acyl-homoserine lactone synthase